MESGILSVIEQLGEFSDLHDADLRDMSLRVGQQSLTLSFVGKSVEDEATYNVDLICEGVVDFVITAPEAVDESFSDYRFPRNSLVDSIDICLRAGTASVIIRGMYSWTINFCCTNVALATSEHS
jgi:hypothetical protein